MGAIDLGPDNQDAWNDMDDVRAVAPFRQGSIAAAPPTRRTNRELEPAQGVRLRQPGPSRQTGPPPRHVQPETLGGSANTSRRLAPGIGDSYADFQAGAGPRHQASGYRIPVPAPRIPVPAPRIPVPAPRRWPAQNDYDSRHEFEVQVRLGGAGAGSRRLPGGAAAVLQQNEEGVHGQDRHHRTVHRGTPEPAFRRPLQHDASDSDASNGDPYDDDESVSFDDHHHSTIRRGAPEPSLRRPPQHEAYDDDDDVNLSFDQVQHGHHHRTVHRGAPEPSLHRPPQHEAYDDDVNLSFDPAQHDRRHRTIHHGPPEPVLRRPAQNFAGNDSYDSMDDKADNMDNGKNHSIGLSQDRGRSYQFAAAAPVLQRRPAAPVLQRRPADSGDDEDFPIGVGQDQGDHATVFSRRHAQEQGSTHECSQIISPFSLLIHSFLCTSPHRLESFCGHRAGCR
ncbi:hypothetical protein B0H16DRAFT_283311 [Mycena metata]|uniref:Uncharacterized protein n=1 Tax=Mycena metata TaxID=1033252 RepID=A0AAD7HPN1_9AGAR|nr:hypothetical protein B0H16DRAFT_283311 [Mycena metata]